MKKISAAIKSFFKLIQSLFLNGLFTLLPIVLTVAFFIFFFRLLKNWLSPIHNIVPLVFRDLPGSEIILTIIAIFVLGTILKYLLLQPLIHFFESLLQRIPLIRSVYFGIKQLVHAFTFQDEKSFKQVIITQFPRKGIYSLGFITSEPQFEINLKSEQRLYHVYIPTTPNPTTGYFVVIPEDELEIIDLTRQEAMALIISGGILQPERLIKKQAK